MTTITSQKSSDTTHIIYRPRIIYIQSLEAQVAPRFVYLFQTPLPRSPTINKIAFPEPQPLKFNNNINLMPTTLLELLWSIHLIIQPLIPILPYHVNGKDEYRRSKTWQRVLPQVREERMTPPCVLSLEWHLFDLL